MSVLEVVIGCGVMSVLLAMAVPMALTTRDDWAVRAAARYVASQASLARAQAVRRGAAVGLKFELTAEGYQFGSYLDGDGDGVQTRDIAGGVDLALQPPVLLAARFPSVRFALSPELPPVDGGRAAGVDFDPVRLGEGDILSYSPFGTSTSGSLYLSGRSGRQYVVRILGTTGRLRVLRFDEEARVWSER